MVSIGPRPVKNELAIGIVFQIERCEPCELFSVKNSYVLWHPSLFRTYATVCFQCRKKFVAQEGIAGTADPIPVPGRNIMDIVDNRRVQDNPGFQLSRDEQC